MTGARVNGGEGDADRKAHKLRNGERQVQLVQKRYRNLTTVPLGILNGAET